MADKARKRYSITPDTTMKSPMTVVATMATVFAAAGKVHMMGKVMRIVRPSHVAEFKACITETRIGAKSLKRTMPELDATEAKAGLVCIQATN
jgi:hypothetical protein